METTGFANRKMPNTGGWQDRHDRAWRSSLAPGLKPHSEASAREYVERSIVVMLMIGMRRIALDAIAQQMTPEEREAATRALLSAQPAKQINRKRLAHGRKNTTRSVR